MIYLGPHDEIHVSGHGVVRVGEEFTPSEDVMQGLLERTDFAKAEVQLPPVPMHERPAPEVVEDEPGEEVPVETSEDPAVPTEPAAEPVPAPEEPAVPAEPAAPTEDPQPATEAPAEPSPAEAPAPSEG